jgi:hypothetical protein
MANDPVEQNTKAQLEALGRFVETFELMVNEVRAMCVERICHGLGSAVGLDPLVELAFHYQVMTARPLYDILRAIIAQIVSRLDHFHFAGRSEIKSLLSYIGVAYSDLCDKRNKLLHGTWFIGYATGDDPSAANLRSGRTA